MSAIKTKASPVPLASLAGLVPFLLPVKDVILLIAQTIEEVSDNNYQCLYLLRRCTHVCIHINKLCLEKDVMDSFGLEEFKQCVIIRFRSVMTVVKCHRSALDKIQICVEHLSRKSPLQRFLQRREISESIKEGHQCLDDYLELFHVRLPPPCRVLDPGSHFAINQVTSDIRSRFRFR